MYELMTKLCDMIAAYINMGECYECGNWEFYFPGIMFIDNSYSKGEWIERNGFYHVVHNLKCETSLDQQPVYF